MASRWTLDVGFRKLEQEMRHERVHTLVWCAPGFGWEMQADVQPLSVDALCTLLTELKESGVAVPPFAVLCFKRGARRAAARIAAAGVRTVISLRADVM